MFYYKKSVKQKKKNEGTMSYKINYERLKVFADRTSIS